MTRIKLAIGQQFTAWGSAGSSYHALRRQPPGKPILVTGPYRSGTTWVGEMLAGPGVWHLHEPFSPHVGVWPEYFSYRRHYERDSGLDDYAHGLCTGRIIGGSGKFFLRGVPANRGGMPARLGLYARAVNRVLIKDPIACLLSEYLVRNHGVVAVVVLRHPAGFAGSLLKLGWDTAAQLRNLLGNQALMEDWLHPFATMMEAQSRNPDLKSHVVLFGALWRVIWGFSQRSSDFVVVNYEDLCRAPEREFAALYRRLGLPLQESDLARHEKLTKGKAPSEVVSPFDVQRDTKASRQAWSQNLTVSQTRAVRDLWQQFELPFFQGDFEW